MTKKRHLGLGTTKDGDFKLPLNTLQRHLGSFGSSGSGKTVASKVLIEELAISGVPVIAFDPQGDIASLAMPEDDSVLKEKGVDLKKREAFLQNVEVLIWTPGIDKGLPICINPLQFEDIQDLSSQDRTRLFSVTAKNIVSLIGYDLGSDDGKTAEAILETVFNHSSSAGTALKNFPELSGVLSDPPDAVMDVVKGVASSKFLDGLIKKINLLNVGSRKLIFQNGMPANIDALIGKDSSSGKTRVSVIYLNALHTAEEKEFFIASIAQSLYRWMLKNPLKGGQDGLQCALFLDEIAPYIPPVKKPACKESLELIFRQGRKYGVSCIIATQSPGDVDYKAIGQFSSFTLGTLNTKQDIANVKRRLESVAPKEVDFIIKKLPALQPGEFLFVSPDAFDSVQELSVRWLLTKHTVVSEDQLKNLIEDDHRELYSSGPDTHDQDKMVEPVQKKDVETEKKETRLKPSSNEEDKVFYMKNQIFEREISDKVKPFLAGSLFKSEVFEEATFDYLPLIKVDLTFFEKKGIFRKKTKEIRENLYLDHKDHRLFYLKDDVFQYSSVVDEDPHKIIDLDNVGKIESRNKNEIDYDFRQLGRRSISQKEITSLMERKYDVKVHSSELMLMPIWECSIKAKKGDNRRILILDGVTGKEVRK